MGISVFSMVLGDPSERIARPPPTPQRNRDSHVENRSLAPFYLEPKSSLTVIGSLTSQPNVQHPAPSPRAPSRYLALWTILYKHAKPQQTDYWF